MPVLRFCVAVPSTPSDGDAGRPDEDTFGVSFLVNDGDETAAKDVALGVSAERLCVSTHNIFFFKGPLQGFVLCVDMQRWDIKTTNHQTHVTVIFLGRLFGH